MAVGQLSSIFFLSSSGDSCCLCQMNLMQN